MFQKIGRFVEREKKIFNDLYIIALLILLFIDSSRSCIPNNEGFYEY